MDSDTVGRIWLRIVSGFQASLQADCRYALDLSPADQQADEDFDMAVIATIEMHLLPQLGHAQVPADAISTLTKALKDGSRLYDLAIEDHDGLASPAMTLVNSGEGRFKEDYADQSSWSTINGEMDGTTIGERERPRERFAYWAFDLLFSMCASAGQGEPLPSLLNLADVDCRTQAKSGSGWQL